MNYRVDRFGAGIATTTLSSLTLVLTAILVVLIFAVPRKHITTVVLTGSLLIPMGQAVGIGPFHVMVCRILLATGWIRLAASGVGRVTWNGLDRAVVLWAFSFTLAFIGLYENIQSLVNRLGFLYNTFGAYFLFRYLTKDLKDFQRLIKVIAWTSAAISVLMVLEQITGKNAFSYLGGVPELTIIREGKLRSQGPFGHAILAGTFGAVILPLFIGLWQSASGSKKTAVLGMICSTIITITCRSSTPIMVCAAGVAAILFWPYRKRMRLFRWDLSTLVILLHMVMKAPVWALIGRIDLTGSSSGYHRYMLVDQSIRHFSQWWLCGVKETADWGWDLGDTADQYVETAVTGGVFTLALFISILVMAFKLIGKARKRVAENPPNERFIWAVGAALLANLVAFVGISYFDQSQLVWLAILATISSATQRIGKTELAPQSTPEGCWGQAPVVSPERLEVLEERCAAKESTWW
jgi:hypothetical protein